MSVFISLLLRCVALLTDPGGQSGDLVAPGPSAVCTFPQFVCPQPAEESQSRATVERAQPEGIRRRKK
jgi:hypothetical protein